MVVSNSDSDLPSTGHRRRIPALGSPGDDPPDHQPQDGRVAHVRHLARGAAVEERHEERSRPPHGRRQGGHRPLRLPAAGRADHRGDGGPLRVRGGGADPDPGGADPALQGSRGDARHDGGGGGEGGRAGSQERQPLQLPLLRQAQHAGLPQVAQSI